MAGLVVCLFIIIQPIHVYFTLQVVEKTDLVGRDFLWEICLNIPDESIADNAIHLLLSISYSNLTSKLKKVWSWFNHWSVHFSQACEISGTI